MSAIDPRTPAGVAHIARLSRLALGESERSAMAVHLGRILDSVAALEQVDVSAIDLSEHDALAPALRPDSVAPSLSRADALANAPRRTSEGFEVPRVVAE